MNSYLDDIRKKVKTKLQRDRFIHTIGVADTAACLAMRYGYDVEKAYLAGLLHDCAKNIKGDERKEKLKKYRVKLTEGEKNIPALIHAPLGAAVAKKEYGVKDEEVLLAIRYHTTGRKEMSLLEKIVYIADYIEPNRDKAPNLKELRTEAFEDLDLAIYHIAEGSISYVTSNPEAYLDPTTVEVRDYYKKIIDERK